MRYTILIIFLGHFSSIFGQIDANASEHNFFKQGNQEFLLQPKNDLIQIDPSSKRIFSNQTVYVIQDFERTHKSKTYKNRINSDAEIANIGVDVLTRSTLFLFDKTLKALLMPKEKSKTTIVSSSAQKGKGIKN